MAKNCFESFSQNKAAKSCINFKILNFFSEKLKEKIARFVVAFSTFVPFECAPPLSFHFISDF